MFMQLNKTTKQTKRYESNRRDKEPIKRCRNLIMIVF